MHILSHLCVILLHWLHLLWQKEAPHHCEGFLRYGNKKLRVGDYVLVTACW